jgi:predicted dehydrogenase
VPRRPNRIEQLTARALRRALRRRPPTSAPTRDEDRERRVRFIERFASAIANGQPPTPTLEDGLAVQAIIAAAYRAASEGVVVRPADMLLEAGR